MEDFFAPPENSEKPPQSNIPIPSQITPEALERMKQQAREMAVAQYYAQQQAPKTGSTFESNQPLQVPAKIVYVRRNLTIAELLLIFAVSCSLVYGVPAIWNSITQNLPRIEIKVK
jgi:hypothetical protein